MAGITLEQAQARLDEYLAAEAAVLAKQSYAIAGRQLSLANLAEIQKGIEIWNNRATLLGAQAQGRTRARVIVPSG